MTVTRLLLESKLIACANIIPKVTSLFYWEGDIEVTQEVKLFFKTRTDKFDEIEKTIQTNCSYDVPEIIMIPIQKGHQPYLKFITEALQPTS
jgi:periplasmic divalent cation tolerance protein